MNNRQITYTLTTDRIELTFVSLAGAEREFDAVIKIAPWATVNSFDHKGRFYRNCFHFEAAA